MVDIPDWVVSLLCSPFFIHHSVVIFYGILYVSINFSKFFYTAKYWGFFYLRRQTVHDQFSLYLIFEINSFL